MRIRIKLFIRGFYEDLGRERGEPLNFGKKKKKKKKKKMKKKNQKISCFENKKFLTIKKNFFFINNVEI